MSGPGFEFFPVDLDSSVEFFIVYALLGGIGVLLAKASQHIALDVTDPPLSDDSPPSSLGEGARKPFHAPLRVGHFPRADEIDDVAYLRDGLDGLVDATLARATGEGWLGGRKGGELTIESADALVSNASRPLKVRLPHGHVSLDRARRIARGIVVDRESKIVNRLVERGLLRTPSRLLIGVIVYGLVALSVLSLGAARIARSAELGESVALTAFEMALLAGGFVFLSRPRRTTSAGQKYLAWLTDATSTLRGRVLERRARTADDIALAAAVGGAAVVPALVIASFGIPTTADTLVTSCSVGVEPDGGACSADIANSCSAGGGCGGSSEGEGGGGCGT